MTLWVNRYDAGDGIPLAHHRVKPVAPNAVFAGAQRLVVSPRAARYACVHARDCDGAMRSNAGVAGARSARANGLRDNPRSAKPKRMLCSRRVPGDRLRAAS